MGGGPSKTPPPVVETSSPPIGPRKYTKFDAFESEAGEPNAKHRSFVNHPVTNTTKVTRLPGVSKRLGKQLNARGYTTAKVFVLRFQLLNRNMDDFMLWLRDEAGVKDQITAYVITRCIREYVIKQCDQQGGECPTIEEDDNNNNNQE